MSALLMLPHSSILYNIDENFVVNRLLVFLLLDSIRPSD